MRVRIRGARDLVEYLKVLRREPAEIESLIEELTIHVTEFYRDPTAFDAFRSSVLPALARDRPEGELTFWSAACSTGEEPYTIAFCVLDALPGRIFSVFATDVDAPALQRASEAGYGVKATRDLPKNLAARFLEERADALIVRPEVKRRVKFVRHDLVHEPLSRTFDVVFCRNVLIYFAREAQSAALAHLLASVRPGGWLILGKTETLLPEHRDFYDAVDLRERIFRRKTDAAS